MKTAITEKLEAREIPYTVKPHRRPVFTSEDAAAERGVHLSQIIKTMLLGNERGEVVVAVLPGDKRLDVKKLKRLTGSKDLRFMDGTAVQERFGFVVGAIAPVSDILAGLPLFVDPGVYEEEFVDISSGDPCAGLELRSADLKKLLEDAVVAEIVKKE